MKVFETPGNVTLQVKLSSGRVTVATTEEARTTVELTGRRDGEFEDIEVTCQERRGGHVIKIEQRDRFRWGPIGISWGEDFLVKIACPLGADLDLTGGSTDLDVDGDLGEVAIKTASGDVKLDGVGKKIDAKTASGDLRIRSIDAGGTVATVSGDMDVRRIAESVTARSVSGDIEIGFLRAPLELATTSGDVNVESVAAGEVRFQTVSGDVRIGVAPGTRVWIDAVSVSGDLDSQLGIDDQVPEEAAGDGSGDVVPLQGRTVSGDVQIVRGAPDVD